MFALSYKSKQYLLLVLKVFILIVTFGYIYLKITQNNTLDFRVFLKDVCRENAILSVIVFVLLAAANWFFEILKWKAIVLKVKPISFFTSLQQSLSSLTVSLATPNRIGEYGAKAYFFEKEKRKDILLLNFFHNAFQMGVTVFFGMIGLLIILKKHTIDFSSNINSWNLSLGILVLVILGAFGFYFRKKQWLIKGLTFSNIYVKFKEIPSLVKWKVVLFSAIRYLIFCTLFFKLLLFFGVDVKLTDAFPLIFTMYLFSSIIPTIFIFDVVVKGGVSVWLFSLLGVAEIPVLSTVFCMWILNFVIPAIVGSYYLFSYNPKTI